MKFDNEELDKQTLARLEKNGIFLNSDAPALNKEQALVLIGEAILDKFVKEFVSLWKNELFPNCLLKDFEVLEEEKQQVLVDQDADKDRNSTLSGQDNNGFRKQEEQTGVDYCDTLAKMTKSVRIARQPILGIYRNSDRQYRSAIQRTAKYKQQALSGCVRNYQLPGRTKFYRLAKAKLPKLDQRFWKTASKTRYFRSTAKVPEVYEKQRSSKSDRFRRDWYKSLESYLDKL